MSGPKWEVWANGWLRFGVSRPVTPADFAYLGDGGEEAHAALVAAVRAAERWAKAEALVREMSIILSHIPCDWCGGGDEHRPGVCLVADLVALTEGDESDG